MRDFWKMIVDYKVSAIVMLCATNEVTKFYSISIIRHIRVAAIHTG